MNGESQRLTVFLSYSRKDTDRTVALHAFLEKEGFRVTMDTEDIQPGEVWKYRLETLVDDADAVVFLLSPSSLGSEVCAWEVDYAAGQGKRIVPVVLEDAAEMMIPDRLQERNYLFLRNDREWAENLSRLAGSLRENARWMLYQTRLLSRAVAWEALGRASSELLAGQALREAESHLLAPPKDAPQIPVLVSAYVQASLAAD